MFQFGEKFWFFLFWLVPFIWILGFYFNRKKLKKIKSFFGENSFRFLTSSLSLKKREWKRILECLALFFFILALMQPQWGKSLKKIKSHGIELVILFDVSKSMLAEDVRPNRLEFAKREVIRFLNLSKGDKIGLLGFAGSSILLSPLTSDYSALKMYVESLSTNSISTQGTDYGKALLEAKKAFERGGATKTKNDVVTRALLIVSDGEDNEKGVSDVIQELKKENIYVFSLLFGTEKGGVIPLKDGSGKVLSYQKNASGQVVLTQAKGDLLKSLSLQGKGSFYHAVYGENTAFKLREDLEKLQKTEFEEKSQMDFQEQYQIFLLIGLFFALIELLLGDRKGVQKKWFGRFIPFALPLFLLFIPQEGKSNLKVILKNNKGTRFLVQGKTEEAQKSFLKALKDEPLNPLHHFHLGLVFEQKGEKEKAIKQYKTTLERVSEIKGQAARRGPFEKNAFRSLNQIHFRALFNLARLYGEKRNLSKALKFYQEALELEPHSKKVKENIEMLWFEGSNQNPSSGKREDQERKENQKEKEDQEKKEGQKEDQKENETGDQKDDSKREEEQDKKDPEEKKDSSGESDKDSKEEGEEKDSDGDGDSDEEKEKNQSEKTELNKNKEQNENKDDKNEKRENLFNEQDQREKNSSFKSEDLKEGDVLRIFEEIRNQEKEIRAKELEKNRKEEGNEKEW